MAQRKGILLITPGFPSDEKDSTCIPALQIFAAGLAKNLPDYEFTVLALHYPFKKESYRWHGLHVHALHLQATTRWQRLKAVVSVWRWFVRHKRQHNWQGIHAFWLSNAAFAGRWLAWWHRLPFRVTLMGQDALVENQFHRRVAAKQGQVIAVSKKAAAIFQAHQGFMPTVIPWGWGPEPETKPNLRDIDLLGVGSLIPLKNFAAFADVVAKLLPSFPNLKAVIIGEGSEREALENLIEKRQLQNHLELWGSCDRAVVLETMQRSKLLLHPSRYEAFGYVFLEALGSGMTVVSAKVGIAEPSDQWLIGKGCKEWVHLCTKGLAENRTIKPCWPFPLAEVYIHYRREYSKWLDG